MGEFILTWVIIFTATTGASFMDEGTHPARFPTNEACIEYAKEHGERMADFFRGRNNLALHVNANISAYCDEVDRPA